MKHLAVIADGNRRWARKNGLSIRFGYNQGLITIENCCDWAIKNQIEYLTFYCFSTENWKRSHEEVDLLERLAEEYFTNQLDWYIKKDIRIVFSGRRERISKNLLNCMITTENATQNCKALTIIFGIDYGGRDEIIRAIEAGARTEEEITNFTSRYAPDPEVILRPGGKKRLSNFLLWQSAYSELFFLDCLFPELTDSILDDVLGQYNLTIRNFGGN